MTHKNKLYQVLATHPILDGFGLFMGLVDGKKNIVYHKTYPLMTSQPVNGIYFGTKA